MGKKVLVFSYSSFSVQYKMNTSLYDKNDSFNFNVVTYPLVEQSNMPKIPAYGV